jgi:signal transduction histidine kinase/CheY-like chemotaxis protein
MTSTGVLLFGVLSALVFAFADTISATRTTVDTGVLGAVFVAVIGTLAVARRMNRSLDASVVARAELSSRLKQQQAVARLGQLALTDVAQQELLDEACRDVAAELRADLVAVLELRPDGRTFLLRAGVGWRAEQLDTESFPAGGRSQSGYTLDSHGPVIMHAAAQETRFELSAQMVAAGVTSGLSACIGSNGDSFGVLSAHTHAPRNFSEHDVTFLEAVANVLATGHKRVELETRLRQAEKLEAVGQLAGGVAHDFNNLLVAIRGYSELALGRLAGGDPQAVEYIEAVLAASDRATGLTKQLLAFGRRQVLRPEVLDLNEVVCTTTGLLQVLIGNHVELVTVLAARPVLVKADRGQLEQVIVNLAVNGRDAMPGGGVLTIRVATEDRPLVRGAVAFLSVTDAGTGIDAATALHIFEPFFSTKGDNGTGLGLATVHGIVAQSGGEITLATQPGRGSTFTVQLPLCHGEISHDQAAPLVATTNGTEAILVVEDDAAVRSIVSTMLADHGYEIVDAADGEEAIRQFGASERPIQLIVSDLMMRGLNGQQTVERIRDIEPATKALYMSGYTGDSLVRSGDLGDGTTFIQKPFTSDELATCVRDLLDGAVA